MDVEEFKRLASHVKDGRIPSRSDFSSKRLRNRNNERAVGKVLESFFTKAGLDFGKLDSLLAQDQAELRSVFQKQIADITKHSRFAEAAFRQGIEARRKALRILENPFTSTFIALDTPFVIWEYPHPQFGDVLVDTHYEAYNNWAKIKMGADGGGSDNRWFSFAFPWTNESDNDVVINITSSLVLNGTCSAHAVGGVFSGDSSTLNMYVRLDLMRSSGWGNDPMTGASIDGTYDPSFPIPGDQIVEFEAEGDGWIFGGSDANLQTAFSFSTFDLSHNSVLIPTRATAVFEVVLQIWYNIDGNNISDAVSADFADNDFSVKCPFVQLEIITPQRMA